ncbi:hypothetical protein ACFQ05_04450 [Amycolatopsis umgeniensis]|uniref:Uncharacterized protein n=1 Tax=Amycolatopsis umgeniensis TaxID=336628 RepID=A0A841AZT2_9PSEU|nr:hypothetical protein [Amycolatopsis umgeniensis]MBB5852517.1 hypothetical protein [Amycolatopsis umgeniensis]
MPGYATPAAAITSRFRALAALLTRNATVLEASGLPGEVVAPRSTVYRDVAAQLNLQAGVEGERAAGNPLVLVLSEYETALAMAHRFELLAGQLTANARILTAGTSDVVMRRRARVYRDVAAQVRLLARFEVDEATARRIRAQRPVTEALRMPSRVARQAATRAPRVRAAFLEVLVAAIAKRRRRGWSVARLTLWLRGELRDPQTGAVHPCAEKSFVSYVVALLGGPVGTVAA